MPASLLPARIIFEAAIRAVPDDVRFRLRFVEACRSFPRTARLEGLVMDGVARDFGHSEEAWVARISHADEESSSSPRRGGKGSGDVSAGFLGEADGDDGGPDGGDGAGDGTEGPPAKKARVESGEEEEEGGDDGDPALGLLHEALAAVPTPRMYLEGARFLRLRIQRLLDHGDRGDDVPDEDDDEDYYDASLLIRKGEDSSGAAQRHADLLDALHEKAGEGGMSSVGLTLDRVDFLVGTGRPGRAEAILSDAAPSSEAACDDARLWLRWAEVSGRMMEAKAAGMEEEPSSSPVAILRRALERIPLHHREAHSSILTELMRRLMTRSSTPRTREELKSLFQKLLLLSQGAGHSVPSTKRADGGEEDDGGDEDAGGGGNPASTFLAYLEHAMIDGGAAGGSIGDEVRSIYESVLHHSNYGRSCAGKTEEEALAMKSFFDLCIRFEKADGDGDLSAPGAPKKRSAGDDVVKRKGRKKEGKKARKMRLSRLYESAIGFYQGGGGAWRKVVDGYQRDLDDVKYSF